MVRKMSEDARARKREYDRRRVRALRESNRDEYLAERKAHDEKYREQHREERRAAQRRRYHESR